MATYYIDPSFVGTSDGSITNPWKSWSGFSFEDGNTYLQKCGTVHQGGNILIDMKNNITIGSYGDGAKPVIQLTANNPCFWTKRSNNISFDNFELIGILTPEQDGAGIALSYHWSDPLVTSTNITISNCVMHRLGGGVRSLPQSLDLHTVSNVTIRNCEIYDIYEDAVFLQNVNNTTIDGCHIHHFNQAWFFGAVAPGDGIQLTGSFSNWMIKNCVVDKSDVPCKFAVIVANDNDSPDSGGSFIHNTIYPPMNAEPNPANSSTGGSGLSFYSIAGAQNTSTWVCSYNHFVGDVSPSGNQPGLYLVEAGNLECNYNVFENTSYTSTIYNWQNVEFCNNTIISKSSITGASIVDISAVAVGGKAINNVAAANTTDTPLNFGYGLNANFVRRNNVIHRGDGSDFNSYLGIIDYAAGNYQIADNTSILFDTGEDYPTYPLDFKGTTVPNGEHRDIGAFEYGFRTIYLDPTNTQQNQNGTIQNPYSSFTQFTLGYSNGLVIPGNSVILMKRGTVLDEFPNRYGLSFRRNNITLGVYGEGARPIIKHSTTHTRANTCAIGQSQNITVHGICFYGGNPGDHYRGGAFVMAGEPVGSITKNIRIYDCEIAYYDMAIYMDQYFPDEGVVLADIYIGDMDLQLGNYIHDTWTDGIFLAQSSRFANTGELYIGYNEIVRTSQGFIYGEICGPGAEGDQLQVIYFNDGLIEHNLFDKRGVSGKMVFLWSADPGERDGQPTTRKLIFRYNTILPGFRFKEGYYCPDGYNIGNHHIAQIYACDKIWFHGNILDTTQWDYKVNERYGKTEQPVAAFSRMDGRKVYFYDNILIGILPGNVLQSGTLQGDVQVDFINNTIIPYFTIDNSAMFACNGEKTNSQNNVMLGSNGITDWIISRGPGSTDINNITETHGSGEGFGDLAYFGNKYGFVDAINKDFRLTAGSVLKNAGTPFAFDTTGWEGYETTVRLDPCGVTKPVGLWDLGAYEFLESSNPLPDPMQHVWVSDVTYSSFVGSWDKVNYADGYKITIMHGDGTPFIPYQNYDVGDVSSFTLEEMMPNSDYAFFVKGYNAYGEGYGLSVDFATMCEPPVIVSFVASKTEIYVGEYISFSCVVESCADVSYSWSFENGVPVSSVSAAPMVKWTVPGTYNVSLTVVNESGTATLVKEDYIKVKAVVVPPKADFSMNVAVGAPVSFTDFSTNNPIKWEWTFKGAMPGISNVKNPSNIIWKTPGRYDVLLRVTNEGGSSEFAMKVNVGKKPMPVPVPVSDTGISATSVR